jgi:glucosyl-3-phosphoglycerate synthase
MWAMDADLRRLLAAKGAQSVTVCLPARDEAATIAAIVAVARGLHPLVDEVLVVDDGSRDGTARLARAAGARVVSTGEVLADHGRGPGKGQAMWKGLAEARGDVVAYCDADVENFEAHFVTRLLEPLLADDRVAFVKGYYERPFHGLAGEGGRVTELVARPVLDLLFPPLARIAQPLGGECAGRRSVLEQVPFVAGYGVDIGLLIDIGRRFGWGAIAQVDLGVRVHRNRSLRELGPQARVVLHTALSRAGVGAGGPVAELPPLAGLAPARESA